MYAGSRLLNLHVGIVDEWPAVPSNVTHVCGNYTDTTSVAEWTSVCNSTGRSVILYKTHFYNDDTYDHINICEVQVFGTYDRG